MREEFLRIRKPSSIELNMPVYVVHTMVIGSGAAGLNAALQLRVNGIEDVLIVTEGLQMGTSINAGSDKQTYYKLSLCGGQKDSPEALAETLFAGGGMHGDLALVEASLSARAFFHLVNLGVPFPRDRFGEFVGYKTDHDPRQRATSVGPHTSREMCLVLTREVRRHGIPILEGRIIVSLLTLGGDREKRIAGAIALNVGQNIGRAENWPSGFEIYWAENVIFAVGGPGGLYKASVYPKVHMGAIGLALLVGAKAQNLPESQFGLSSIKFRWNVSGSYMQVIPRVISTSVDGCQDEQEFLRPYFDSVGKMNSAIFLKGYQWPFDTRKIIGGSSLIDLLAYIETVIKGRRVFLDFRRNGDGFNLINLSPEALDYLAKSRALIESSPIDRLQAMNPGAIDLYQSQGISLKMEPLEIAVCSQHNMGGLAGNLWWESVNIKHLFPVGEVNGSHGVSRPGGSALNSGQVGGFRAAEYIAQRYKGWTLDLKEAQEAARSTIEALFDWVTRCQISSTPWEKEREEFQIRMTNAGAHIRSPDVLFKAVSAAWEQWFRYKMTGSFFSSLRDLSEVLKNRQLCYAHAVYLEAILYAVRSGVGSRGSALVLDRDGIPIHKDLEDRWRFAPENPDFREKVLETLPGKDGRVENRWVERHPLPKTDAWFETTWAAFQKGEIYQD
jgi:succinate dehydrogenase/fumarate reductase flavoprotein subunit